MALNPRVELPDIPKTATREEIIEAIGRNINDQEVHEATARNYVIRCLAALGNRVLPNVVQGKIDGYIVRMYQWLNSPVGNVVLAVGPQYRPKFVDMAKLVRKMEGDQLYVLASPDTTNNARDARNMSKHLADRPSTKAAAEVVAEAERQTPPPPSTPPTRTPPARGSRSSAPQTGEPPRARQRTAAPPPPPPPPPPAPPPPPPASDEAAEKKELASFLQGFLG